ncbi:hypothetical protein CSPX01_01161 [Colletotrichum filicis]|nr:hypothetical protein CSPX01_01161 [Colletotrichum filicis]
MSWRSRVFVGDDPTLGLQKADGVRSHVIVPPDTPDQQTLVYFVNSLRRGGIGGPSHQALGINCRKERQD